MNKIKNFDSTRIWQILATERVYSLAVLTGLMVFIFMLLGNNGYLFAPFDLAYMASSLQALAPLGLLALAEMFVIISGRSGIDLSVGAIVSLAGILFGYLLEFQKVPLLPAVLITIVCGLLLGLINGIMVAYFGFPPLIATLATAYAYASLALVFSNQSPISGKTITQSNQILTQNVPITEEITLPIQVLTFLLPAVIISWFLLEKTVWGKSLLAVGTNDIAANYSAQPVNLIRASAYAVSGLLCGIAAVVNVAQFASARPDAGTAGSGMTLPAITIAVLGGVLIQGGYGRISGVTVGALLITWLNAGLLISMEGNAGPRAQLLALGLVLLVAILINNYANNRLNRKS